VTSPTVDLGLYLGREEVALAVLGRSEEALVCTPDNGAGFSLVFDESSSAEDNIGCRAEFLLRCPVLASGVSVRLETWDSGLTSPIEARGAEGREMIVLERRDDASFAFLAALLDSLLLSVLFITSTMALPIDDRLRDCLMELLVFGFDFGLADVLESSGMIVIREERKKKMRS